MLAMDSPIGLSYGVDVEEPVFSPLPKHLQSSRRIGQIDAASMAHVRSISVSMTPIICTALLWMFEPSGATVVSIDRPRIAALAQFLL